MGDHCTYSDDDDADDENDENDVNDVNNVNDENDVNFGPTVGTIVGRRSYPKFGESAAKIFAEMSVEMLYPT